MKNAHSEDRKIILWDIDGTIIKSQQDKLQSIHKKSLEKQGFSSKDKVLQNSGLTDFEIIDSLYVVKDKQEKILINAFDDLDKIFLSNLQLRDTFICEGILDSLSLANKLGWTNGILTGNTHLRAIHKLSEVGILHFFDRQYIFVCQFGETRNMIANRAKITLNEFAFKKTLVIGDTPKDIEVAKILNCPIISVLTGKFSRDEIYTYKPTLIVQNLKIGFQTFNEFLQNI
jgi:phosphoglycolate phosphatase